MAQRVPHSACSVSTWVRKSPAARKGSNKSIRSSNLQSLHNTASSFSNSQGEQKLETHTVLDKVLKQLCRKIMCSTSLTPRASMPKQRNSLTHLASLAHQCGERVDREALGSFQFRGRGHWQIKTDSQDLRCFCSSRLLRTSLCPTNHAQISRTTTKTIKGKMQFEEKEQNTRNRLRELVSWSTVSYHFQCWCPISECRLESWFF